MSSTLQLGGLDVASIGSYIFGFQGVAAGNTNAAGSDGTFNGSRSTGTGVGGGFIFNTTPAGSTGTVQNAETLAMKITGSGTVGIGTSTPLTPFDVNGTAGVAQLVGRGIAPTIAAGTGAGTTPTVSVTGTTIAGVVNVTTGTSPTAGGTVATVTFNGTLTAAPQGCSLHPRNAATALAAAMIYSTAPTTTTWTIGNGATALTPSTAYSWSYVCE